MAEKSGFFNALRVNGEYDRKYNAGDYSDNLAVVIGNGVLRSDNDDLRVTANNMQVTVAAGRAWIEGHFYHNDAPLTFTAPAAPSGGTRWDRIMLQLDSDVTARSIKLRYVQGAASGTPTKPAPVRDGSVYELVLADIYVGTNATSVVVTDTRDDSSICGWVYSTRGNESFFKSLDNEFATWLADKKDTLASVTLFKRYNWRTVLEAAATNVQFNIPQWNPDTAFMEVWVNGVLDVEGVDYTHNGSVLTFANPLIAGTEIVVKVFKSIDGTGIMSVADEITELQNAVAAMKVPASYDYYCNGVDDNVKLSEIAQAYMSVDSHGTKTIRVFGKFGAAAPYSGSGTAASPYKWIQVGTKILTDRSITFDFTACDMIVLKPVAGKVNHIFAGGNVRILGANIYAAEFAEGTTVIAFDGHNDAVYAERCHVYFHCATGSMVAKRGTFVNCRADILNDVGDSFCFQPAASNIVRIMGGEYCAHTKDTSAKTAIVALTESKATAILHAVYLSGCKYDETRQTYALYQTNSTSFLRCRDLVAALPNIVLANASEVQGTIDFVSPIVYW
jgi:hypothetical protein